MVPQILMYLMIAIYFGSLWKIFEKAGRKKWEGFIPVYNIFIWLKIINKPWWWAFFFIIPFVNFVVTIGCNVETARLFGKYSPKDTLLTILLPWYYIPFLAYKKDNQLVEPTDWTKEKDLSKRKIHDHITLLFIAPLVGHALMIVFWILGNVLGSKKKPNKKSMACEWTNALGFAIVAASIIRTFFFEAFTIPTGSMEKTMRVGDYLFVNKMEYGAKLPQTPMSIPFVHNRIPGTFIPSFVEWFKIDYHRLPGYGEIKRNDIMVFNWPVGDSVIVHDDVIAHDYYAILRNEAFYNCAVDFNEYAYDSKGYLKATLTKEKYFKDHMDRYMKETRDNLINGGKINMSPAGKMIENTGGIATLPIDKKENYIKRCVSIGGDTLEIRDNLIYINGIAEELPSEALFRYEIKFKSPYMLPRPEIEDGKVIFDELTEKYEIYQDQHGLETGIQYNIEHITCSPSTLQSILNDHTDKNDPSKKAEDKYFISYKEDNQPKDYNYAQDLHYCPIFPNHPDFNWSRDNFGPLYIPKAGSSIDLTPKNWIIYKRAIEVYEHNEVEHIQGGPFIINGAEVTTYTFKQNYYWLMGDNRHGSADSRYWGFVPEDHVVGTSSFVWFSKHLETGIRWSRIFSFIE